jgi:streptomycin 3"-adenylyltransferase
MGRPVAEPELRAALAAILPGAVGAYLHGSAGLGRLRPQSDLDVVVVTDARLSDDERVALTTFALRTSGRYPRAADGPRPLEVTVVALADVRPWRFPPRCDFLYGEWLRAGIEDGVHPSAFQSADLAVVLAMVLKCDAPLFGPSPGDLFGPVPVADLRRSGRDGVPGLLDALEADTTNVLLTLARIAYTASTGSLTTKDAAATWAADRCGSESEAVLLRRARDAYLAGTPHEWGPVDDDVRALAAALVATIDDDV